MKMTFGINTIKNIYQTYISKKPTKEAQMIRLKKSLGINSLFELKQTPKNPDRVIWHNKNTYTLLSLKQKKQLAIMRVFTEVNEYYDTLKAQKSLFIAQIRAKTRKQGDGRQLFNFAKLLAKKTNGCEGRLTLVAHDLSHPPFKFYRRQGMDSKDKNAMEIIDYCVENNIPLPRECKNWKIEMFLQQPHNKSAL